MDYSINVSLKSVPIYPKERGALVEPGGTVTEKGLFWLHNAHQWLRTKDSSAFSKIDLLLFPEERHGNVCEVISESLKDVKSLLSTTTWSAVVYCKNFEYFIFCYSCYVENVASFPVAQHNMARSKNKKL